MNIDNNHTRFNFQISWLLIASSRKENQDIDPYPALSLMSLFSSVQSLSRVQLFATPWTAARQAYLSITNSWSSPKLVSIESVIPSNHLILCRPQAASKTNQKNAGGVKRKEPLRHPFNLPERLALETVLTERCTRHQEGLWVG